MDGSLGHLSEPDNQQSLGGEARRGVKEHRLIGASLIFPGPEHACRCGQNRRIGSQQRGLGLGVRAFFGLGVGGQNGQKFGSNPRDRGNGEFSSHGAYSSRIARLVANHRMSGPRIASRPPPWKYSTNLDANKGHFITD